MWSDSDGTIPSSLSGTGHWDSAPTWCFCGVDPESQHPWVPLPALFRFFSSPSLRSFCHFVPRRPPHPLLLSPQPAVLCAGEGRRDRGRVRGRWNESRRVSGNVRLETENNFFLLLMDSSVSPLLSCPLPTSPLLSLCFSFPSPVRTISVGFSSPLGLRSSTITWLLLNAAPSRRRTHYGTKVRGNTQKRDW